VSQKALLSEEKKGLQPIPKEKELGYTFKTGAREKE